MTHDGNFGRDPDPPRPVPGGLGASPNVPGGMPEKERRQYALEQQMMEARLEIVRSHRQQNEARVSRVVNFFFVFVTAGAVFYVLDHKGYGPEVSIGGSVGVIVAIGTWYAYRKVY